MAVRFSSCLCGESRAYDHQFLMIVCVRVLGERILREKRNSCLTNIFIYVYNKPNFIFK